MQSQEVLKARPLRAFSLVRRPGSGASSILWHIHADAYDQSRSIRIDPQTTIGKITYDIRNLSRPDAQSLGQFAGASRAPPGDLTDYHQRILRQAMDCDLDEGEIPALISDGLSPEQIADAFTLAGVNSL
jgi:hypothetical protein